MATRVKYNNPTIVSKSPAREIHQDRFRDYWQEFQERCKDKPKERRCDRENNSPLQYLHVQKNWLFPILSSQKVNIGISKSDYIIK